MLLLQDYEKFSTATTFHCNFLASTDPKSEEKLRHPNHSPLARWENFVPISWHRGFIIPRRMVLNSYHSRAEPLLWKRRSQGTFWMASLTRTSGITLVLTGEAIDSKGMKTYNSILSLSIKRLTP
ncbi:hypothetical protein AVEN_124681-1 [Araneus ventricosus]|uniref:Uncharacterized protein n=1 Tax=Araneus ventricosus TaxID=182803 RepID=A0A4Y2JMA2_ARAVE|nr:hypothetical protein AVEN_124681-1 [Araneus ventricosus]